VVNFDLDTRVEYSILVVSGHLLTHDVGYYNLTGGYVFMSSVTASTALTLLFYQS
jgi:hypothetical protein